MAGIVFAIAAAGVLLVLFLIDILTPADFSFTALSIFPILAVAWLCSAREVLGLTIFAVVLHAGLAVHGELSFSRGSVHILADISMAIIGRLASLSLASVRESREKELQTLLEIARTLSSVGELQEVLQEVARASASFVSHGEHGRGRAQRLQAPRRRCAGGRRERIGAQTPGWTRLLDQSPADGYPGHRSSPGGSGHGDGSGDAEGIRGG